MQVSVRFGMYRFRISSSSDRTALASGFPLRSDCRYRLHWLVAMAVRDDRCRLVGLVSVTFSSPLISINACGVWGTRAGI